MPPRILLFSALLLSASLPGCSSLPANGPDGADFAAQAVVDDVQRYEILDVTAETVNVLSRRPQDSLLATFGDYRPPIDPRIGVGDAVAITIWEAAAGGLFSAPLVTDRFTTGSKSATIPDQVVGRDGSITVPFAGRIRVVNQTVDQVQRTIEQALDGKAIQPQALVSVVRPISKAVTVNGEVANGARIPLTVKGDRLLDVIATAGGLRTPVNETFVQLSRNGRTVRVAMSRIVGDPRENIFMRPDDVVTLVRDPQKVVFYGATGRNAEAPFESESMSLAEGLAKAGGLLDSRADPAGVFVLRYEEPRIVRALAPSSTLLNGKAPIPVVYRINLRDPGGLFLAQRFPLFARDVLYVSNSPSTELAKALGLFSTLVAPVTTGAAVYGLTR
ncbi:MAG: polysaccharide biosynthesis/export family protein [Beijerinckiaceae bacterium]